MDLAASLEAPKFENDWLQSLLKQLTPCSTWSVCHGSSSNCFNWKEFSFHFFLRENWPVPFMETNLQHKTF